MIVDNSRWQWRSVLTDYEKKVVAKYDAAAKRVEAAREAADRWRTPYTKIMNRAIQRARYDAGKRNGKKS